MESVPSHDFQRRLDQVWNRIEAACRRSGRSRREITLVAVSKTFPFSRILPAVEAGQLEFGENYIQDALAKIDEAEAMGLRLRWHFIGHLQRNKARLLDSRFCLFHGLDSLELAARLSRFASEGGYHHDLLVQVNLSGERTKHGVPPDALFAFLERLRYIEAIRVRGLMTIPPPVVDAEESRRWFNELRSLFERARASLFSDDNGFSQLSMGMSSDFEVAVEEGATMVRVGTLLFGSRTAKYQG